MQQHLTLSDTFPVAIQSLGLSTFRFLERRRINSVDGSEACAIAQPYLNVQTRESGSRRSIMSHGLKSKTDRDE